MNDHLCTCETQPTAKNILIFGNKNLGFWNKDNVTWNELVRPKQTRWRGISNTDVFTQKGNINRKSDNSYTLIVIQRRKTENSVHVMVDLKWRTCRYFEFAEITTLNTRNRYNESEITTLQNKYFFLTSTSRQLMYQIRTVPKPMGSNPNHSRTRRGRNAWCHIIPIERRCGWCCQEEPTTHNA